MRLRTLQALTCVLVLAGGILSSCEDEGVDQNAPVLAASLRYILDEDIGVESERIRLAAWTTSDFHQTTCEGDDPECSLLSPDERRALTDAAEGFELSFEDDIREEAVVPHVPNSAGYTFVWLGTPTIDGDDAQIEAVISAPHSRAELILDVERTEGSWAVTSVDSPKQ